MHSVDKNLNMQFRPGSYVAFLPCRMQFKQKIMKQIILLSIVSIALDTAEIRHMNEALYSLLIRHALCWIKCQIVANCTAL